MKPVFTDFMSADQVIKLYQNHSEIELNFLLNNLDLGICQYYIILRDGYELEFYFGMANEVGTSRFFDIRVDKDIGEQKIRELIEQHYYLVSCDYNEVLKIT
jgi:hypothetical protein